MSITFTATDQDGRTGTLIVFGTFATERAYRESLVAETYDPGPDTTGCYDDPAWPSIPRFTIANHTPATGGVYENLIIQGQITPPVGVGRATYRNCELQGPLGSGHLVKAYDAGRIGVDLVDCTLRPRNPDNSRVGIIGRNWTMRRCDVSHVVDGFRVQDTNDPDGPSGVEVWQSYVHDLYWEADTADGTHSDDGQISSGSGTVIRGNTLIGNIAPEYAPNFYGTTHANAVLMIKPDVGLISGLDIRNNLIDGGAIPINIANKTSGTVRTLGSVGTISGNRFGRNARIGASWTITMPVSASATVTVGNVYADNGAAVTVRRQG
jgi:hypothetical protein